MNDRYQFIDPIIKDERDEFKGLSLEKNNKSILRIFRLLSGTSKIEDKFCDKIYPMNINYFLMPFFKNNRFSQKCIKKLFPSDLKLNEISDLFKNVRHNRDFYDAIEAEIVNCLIARKQKRYIEAFLFLYRVLEGISYSIPLIYTAKSKSFTGSFKSLQKYISKNSNDGEISFFKKFIGSLGIRGVVKADSLFRFAL